MCIIFFLTLLWFEAFFSGDFQAVNVTLSCNLCHPLPPAEKAVAYMESADQIDLQEPAEPQGATCQSLCHYVNTINCSPRNIGKDGKFQLLACLGARSAPPELCSYTVEAPQFVLHSQSAKQIECKHSALEIFTVKISGGSCLKGPGPIF